MHHRTWGDGNNKTALLIHGLCSSSRTWKKVGNQLAQEGYNSIAPDLAGHGKSSRSKKYSIEQWSEQTKELIKDRKIDLIIGHSIGGLIAANIAPELKPNRMILLDPVFRFPKQAIGALTKVIFSLSAKTPYWRHKYFPLQKDQNHGPKRSPGRWKDLAQWDMKTSDALKQDKHIVRSILKHNIPTLIVRAKNSYILPALVFKYWSDKPHLTIKYVEGDHNLHWDKPEQIWGEIKEHITTPKTLPLILG